MEQSVLVGSSLRETGSGPVLPWIKHANWSQLECEGDSLPDGSPGTIVQT